MKVIIPIRDLDRGKGMISGKFMENRYFCIYNDQDASSKWVEMNDLTPKSGNLSFALKRAGITTVLVSDIDMVELGLLTESGFSIFKSIGVGLQDNLKMLGQKKLFEMTMQSALGIGASCGSSCGSCSSCK